MDSSFCFALALGIAVGYPLHIFLHEMTHFFIGRLSGFKFNQVCVMYSKRTQWFNRTINGVVFKFGFNWNGQSNCTLVPNQDKPFKSWVFTIGAPMVVHAILLCVFVVLFLNITYQSSFEYVFLTALLGINPIMLKLAIRQGWPESDFARLVQVIKANRNRDASNS